MRTSLNKIKEIEDFLTGRARVEEALLLEVKLLLDQELREKLLYQQQAYHTIRLYGREQIYSEIDAVHRKLFTSPEHKTFKQKILRIFKQGKNYD